MTDKKRVAVFLGGRSPEHDVSVISGLQALAAIDVARYDPFPVYIAVDGAWLVGEPLRERKNYLPDANLRKELTTVTLDITPTGQGVLHPVKKGLFGSPKPITFDVAVPGFHGLIGEDGRIQGLFETANIPYTGMRTMASSLFMDKAVTKRVLSGADIPVLPTRLINRPGQGLLLSPEQLEKAAAGLEFPCCVKPCHLGSSIGVAKVNNAEELNAVLPAVFKFDTAAVVEPFIEDLTEYNIAVMNKDGRIVTSAIERPKRVDDLLDFKQKYMSGGGGKQGGAKSPGESSQGMLSLTRELNPELPEWEEKIRQWASLAFEIVSGTGAPRMDFNFNEKTGEMYLNEVNPCPGSFGYFLWEAAPEPVLFTELMTHLIEEALILHQRAQIPEDPTPEDARLFQRR